MFFLEKFQNQILKVVLFVIIISSSFLLSNEIFFSHYPKIIFLDVGQGDAIFIITPNGRQILVDAGKYSNISEKIAKYMPNSDRSIDLVIATHPDIDHISGFDILLDEYNIEYFIHSGLLAGAPIYRKIAKKVSQNNIFSKSVVAGDKIYIDNDMYLEVLSPIYGIKFDDPNDLSIVLKLYYQGSSILLMGDAPQFIEKDLVAMYGNTLKSEILKLGHHGSRTSSNLDFLKTVGPKYGIISAACNNSFGHPHTDVLKNLDKIGINELDTCEYGDIIFNFVNGRWLLFN